MDTTLATRKQIDQLTLQDLDAFPIWEFASDEEALLGRNETWVRPVDSNVVPLHADGPCVSAEFALANGNVLRGIAVPDLLFGTKEITNAYIIANGCYLSIPVRNTINFTAAYLAESRLKSLLQGLHLSAKEVFPIQCRLHAPVQNEIIPRSSTLEVGFDPL
jgi:hypothetical protein